MSRENADLMFKKSAEKCEQTVRTSSDQRSNYTYISSIVLLVGETCVCTLRVEMSRTDNLKDKGGKT